MSTVAAQPTLHVHRLVYVESGPNGMVAELRPHPRDEAWSWADDGRTCDPETPCIAQSVLTGKRCGKREAVVELDARSQFARRDSEPVQVYLCGGHFGVHRRGVTVRVYVVPGKLR